MNSIMINQKKHQAKKTVIMSIREFINFRSLAFKKRVEFFCSIKDSLYRVECDEEFMEQIGY